MKPWQKIALTTVLSLAVFSVVIIVSIVSLLPSPGSLGVHRPASAPVARPIADEATVSAAASKAAISATTPVKAEVRSPAPALDAAARKKLVSEKFMERYLSSDRIESHVCENLATSTAPFQTMEEFGIQLEKSLLGESPPSASAEALMLPIEYTLKNEAVRELVDSASDAFERGDTGFAQKAQFYAQAARATASVMSSRDELETISADAYQLYSLSRAAALKPEILQDPDMSDLCRGIERSAVDAVDRDRNFDRERMSRLLARHGISNESIGYDPRMSTRLTIVTSENGLQIKMPWLDAVFQNSAKASR
ncbi:hypothetical protein BH10BDE1_BH10BDE1_18750 [soil metagenome]